MVPLWGAVFGVLWIIWLGCVIGGLGNIEILSSFYRKCGFIPSAGYIRGIRAALQEQSSLNN